MKLIAIAIAVLGALIAAYGAVSSWIGRGLYVLVINEQSVTIPSCTARVSGYTVTWSNMSAGERRIVQLVPAGDSSVMLDVKIGSETITKDVHCYVDALDYDGDVVFTVKNYGDVDGVADIRSDVAGFSRFAAPREATSCLCVCGLVVLVCGTMMAMVIWDARRGHRVGTASSAAPERALDEA